MIKVFEHHIPLGTLVELLVDGVLCVLAVVLATGTIVATAGVEPLPLPQGLIAAGLLALIMSLLYAALGVYRHEMPTPRSALVRTLLALVIGAAPTYLMFDLFVGGLYTGHLVVYVLIYLLAGLFLVRQTGLGSRFHAFGARKVLIVGTGAEAQRVAADLRQRSYRQFKVVGFFPESNATAEHLRLEERIFSGDEPLDRVARRERVDEVIVAVKEQRGGVLPLRELLECRIGGVPVRSLAEFYERSKGEVRLDSLKASWLIYGRGFVQHPTRTITKRLFDVVVSLALFLFTWPIMLLTACAIALEDGGPVFFRQERVGYRGRSFMVLKFRSMRTDAERDGVARWAMANDSRVTRVGRVIRKLRIDELPQLLNVLSGEMSLVGPRPERPPFVADLERQIPFYGVRHSVKPGVTGWAQVRTGYGSSIEDAKSKLQFDLYYVKNHTLFLDMLVILETVRVVLFREGAQ